MRVDVHFAILPFCPFDPVQATASHGIEPPALIVIGEVVRLRAAPAQDTFSNGTEAGHAALS